MSNSSLNSPLSQNPDHTQDQDQSTIYDPDESLETEFHGLSFKADESQAKVNSTASITRLLLEQMKDSHAAKEHRAATMHDEELNQRQEEARLRRAMIWRRGEMEKEKNTLATLSPNGSELAQAAAIQNESFVRISIMKEQHRLMQVREDAITEARIKILHEESKQKLEREKESREEKMQALLRETAIHLEIAKEDRRQSLKSWQERSHQMRLKADLQRELMEKEVNARMGGKDGDEDRRSNGAFVDMVEDDEGEDLEGIRI